MVAVLEPTQDFSLPARDELKPGATDSGHARIGLADRIAGLPGIRTVDNGADLLPTSVTVYLHNDDAPLRKRLSPLVLCDISRDGIRVHGLDPGTRLHILATGWGTESGDHVRVFLPRDDDEVDICWTILERAHRSLMNISARSPAPRHTLYRDLPRFSRTTLQ